MLKLPAKWANLLHLKDILVIFSVIPANYFSAREFISFAKNLSGFPRKCTKIGQILAKTAPKRANMPQNGHILAQFNDNLGKMLVFTGAIQG